MKKGQENNGSKTKIIVAGVIVILVLVFIIVPFIMLFAGNSVKLGNIALISMEGPITSDGISYLGQTTISSKDIVHFIEEADENIQVKVIVLEINSPGGSAVASEEVTVAVKKSKKPVVAYIREAGASGAYWIASAADYIIANRMSITGSIGVISSYLEFSGLMSKYGVAYERLVAGSSKDLGTPFRPLELEERKILQKKLNLIHDIFIKEVALNRNLSETKVRELATGEFYLGIEALDLGLVDQVGTKEVLEQYLRQKYNLQEIEYIPYQRPAGFFDILTGAFNEFSFHIGRGIASIFAERENKPLSL